MDNGVDVQKVTLIGGPFCGEEVPSRFRRAWLYSVVDKERGLVHVYARTSPNEPYFHFRASTEDK
jgi:hypothetical protein